MTQKTSHLLAVLLCVLSVLFLFYALRHPEAGFPWSNAVTYALYLADLAAIVVLFIAPWGRKR